MSAATTTLPALQTGERLSLWFADREHRLYGETVIELAGSASGPVALVALFAGSEPIVSDGSAAVAGDSADGGARLVIGPLQLEAGDAGRSWTVNWSGAGGRSLELRFDSSDDLPPPSGAGDESGPGLDAVHAGVGERAFDQQCRVTGTVTVAGSTRQVQGFGQVSRTAKTGGIALERQMAAWLEQDALVSVYATRATAAKDHAGEAVRAVLAESESPEGQLVDEARISTTYDGQGVPMRAGLELWPYPDSDYPRRLAGETRCATTLAAGDGMPWRRWDIAFVEWHMDGRRGIGPYSLLRY